MANPRKPLAVALLHGNPGKRQLNKREPKFTGKPTCPTWLHPLAKREWKRIAAETTGLDLIKATDQSALAAYCQSYARWRTAEEIVEREGQLVQEPIVTRSGNVTGFRWKKHPAVTVAKDERATMLAAGRLFGLSPSSRTSLHVPVEETPAEDESDINDYLFAN